MGMTMIALPVNLLALAYSEAASRNTSLEALIEEALRAALEEPDSFRSNVNLDTMVESAIAAAIEKAAGHKFLLKDLSDTDQWDRMTPTQRKIFGKRFRQAVVGAGIAEFVRRTSANHAEYKRL